MRTALLVLFAVVFLQYSVATAQYIYIDSNGDGTSSALDRLAANGTTKIDIWLQTDRNRDSSPAVSAIRYGVPISVFSYEFILNAVGGTVEWGPYVNALFALPELSATL